jgi:drug/metabolite transporter (DMT)-like permease
VQWMYAVPFILFIPLWFLLGAKAAPETNLDRLAFGWAAGASVASIVALLLMFYALRTFPASVAVAITAAYPVVTLVIAVALRHERLDLPKVLGIGLVVAGIILLQVRGEGAAG